VASIQLLPQPATSYQLIVDGAEKLPPGTKISRKKVAY
jgi:hypothetical protein